MRPSRGHQKPLQPSCLATDFKLLSARWGTSASLLPVLAGWAACAFPHLGLDPALHQYAKKTHGFHGRDRYPGVHRVSQSPPLRPCGGAPPTVSHFDSKRKKRYPSVRPSPPLDLPRSLPSTRTGNMKSKSTLASPLCAIANVPTQQRTNRSLHMSLAWACWPLLGGPPVPAMAL